MLNDKARQKDQILYISTTKQYAQQNRFNPLITSAFYPILYIKLYKAYIK
jgi:hypothetical protein